MSIAQKLEGIAQQVYDLRDSLPAEEKTLWNNLDKIATRVSTLAGLHLNPPMVRDFAKGDRVTYIGRCYPHWNPGTGTVMRVGPKRVSVVWDNFSRCQKYPNQSHYRPISVQKTGERAPAYDK